MTNIDTFMRHDLENNIQELKEEIDNKNTIIQDLLDQNKKLKGKNGE